MLMKNTASFRRSPCVPTTHVAFIAAGECYELGNRGLNVGHKDALLSVLSSVSKKKKFQEQTLFSPCRLAVSVQRYRPCRAK